MTSEHRSTISNFGLTHVIVPPLDGRSYGEGRGDCRRPVCDRGRSGRRRTGGAPRSWVPRNARWRRPIRSRWCTATARRWPSWRTSPTSRGCEPPPRGRCARAAAAGRSRGRSMHRCSRSTIRCARSPKAPSSAATTAGAAAWSASCSAGPATTSRPVAERAALIGRWTNAARALVDAPPNVLTPRALAERAAAVPRIRTEIIDGAGLPALTAVGAGSPAGPLLIVLRHEPPGAPGRAPAGAGREGRHVRRGRLLPEVAAGHRPAEGRHGRRRGGRRGAGRDRRARAPAVGHGRRARVREHAQRRARSGRRT